MKWHIFVSLVLLALWTTPGHAGLSDVQITATKLKLDESKERDFNSTTTTKEYAYEVKVQSKSFKPIENLEIKYMLFYEDESGGKAAEAKGKSHRGVEKIPLLEANRSVTFKTKPLVLKIESLDAGWYYGSGARNKAKDRTSGVWFRAYVNGELIGEYANPSTVLKRDWKE